MIIAVHAFMAVMVVIDQFLKLWALNALKPIGSIKFSDGLLALTYVENRGAAFGIFQGKQTMLIMLTLAIIIGLEYYLLKTKPSDKRLWVSFSLIIAGGVGNLIDRILRGFVVDYIDINGIFSYPMFNFADCCVVVGEILLIFLILSADYKERKQKNGEPKND